MQHKAASFHFQGYCCGIPAIGMQLPEALSAQGCRLWSDASPLQQDQWASAAQSALTAHLITSSVRAGLPSSTSRSMSLPRRPLRPGCSSTLRALQSRHGSASVMQKWKVGFQQSSNIKTQELNGSYFSRLLTLLASCCWCNYVGRHQALLEP